jgi:hypothetical protein
MIEFKQISRAESEKMTKPKDKQRRRRPQGVGGRYLTLRFEIAQATKQGHS